MDKRNFIVITSIFPPNDVIERYARLKEWQLIVVGDRKTPSNWHHDDVIYLSPAAQKELDYRIVDHLPWDHYARKMIGYLYAIEQGATRIVDTDDDNAPMENWGFQPFDAAYDTTAPGVDYLNTYSIFCDRKIWPRGFPLNRINNQEVTGKPFDQQEVRVGVWQGLADGNPDVDAIYRLVDDSPCIFKKRRPVVLTDGTICPFNSQNTAFREQLFPLLYLPAFVTFRFTDILRGLVAQPIMWSAGYKLGFCEATVFQDRNPHDYMKDFESEIPCYLHAEQVVEGVKAAIRPENSVLENLGEAYAALERMNIVPYDEVGLLADWCFDVQHCMNNALR